MNRALVRRAHAVAGGLALLTIMTFWVSTVLTELAGNSEALVTVKHAIPWGLLLLVPALAATGFTGMRLTRNARGRLVRRKLVRTRFVAVIGLLVLVPCVLYLGATASVEDLGTRFYAVQAIELVAGATNITLLMLNAQDGLRLTGRARSRSRRRTVSAAPERNGPAVSSGLRDLPRLDRQSCGGRTR